MYESYEERTSFIIDYGLYCYKARPCSLKYARATYQRLVNMMFMDLIGKTMEVYMEDILVKSRMVGDHVEHLRQMFNVLRKYQMKLSPPKVCLQSRVKQVPRLHSQPTRDIS